MKLCIVSLAIFFLALAVAPAWAGDNPGCQLTGCCGGCPWAYDNGPINGTTDAWEINFGYVVSDTFVTHQTNQYQWVAGFELGVWEFPGDTMTSVQWSITSGENGGTVYASGVAAGANLSDRFLSTNQYGYSMDLIGVSGLNITLGYGTYWLNLQNAVLPSGDPVYWDENSGKNCGGSGCPSMASESVLGTISSEAFTVNGYYYDTPEPGNIILFGSGVLGLAGALRRRCL